MILVILFIRKLKKSLFRTRVYLNIVNFNKNLNPNIPAKQPAADRSVGTLDDRIGISKRFFCNARRKWLENTQD
jgi:hypothetical protein